MSTGIAIEKYRGTVFIDETVVLYHYYANPVWEEGHFMASDETLASSPELYHKELV